MTGVLGKQTRGQSCRQLDDRWGWALLSADGDYGQTIAMKCNCASRGHFGVCGHYEVRDSWDLAFHSMEYSLGENAITATMFSTSEILNGHWTSGYNSRTIFTTRAYLKHPSTFRTELLHVLTSFLVEFRPGPGTEATLVIFTDDSQWDVGERYCVPSCPAKSLSGI